MEAGSVDEFGGGQVLWVSQDRATLATHSHHGCLKSYIGLRSMQL